jgi:uncharacterized membrane protein SirB2
MTHHITTAQSEIATPIIRLFAKKEFMQQRHTSVRIAIYVLILQSVSSILALISYRSIGWRELNNLYTSSERAAWLVAALCSLIQIVAGLLMMRRKRWGRALYMTTAIVAIAFYFAVSPGALALSAVPACVAMLAVLCGRRGSRYFAEQPADQRIGARDVFSVACLIGAAALLYRAYVASFVGGGVDVFFQYKVPSLLDFPVSAVLLAAGLVLSPRESRRWRAGIALGVSAAAMANALIGYLPYWQPLANLPGAPAHVFSILWSGALMMVFFVIGIADQFIRGSRPPRATLNLPDFS